MGREEVGSGGYVSPATWNLCRLASKSHMLQVALWGPGALPPVRPRRSKNPPSFVPWGLRVGNEVL